ncbi:hypothetical protein GCM10007063_34520 [Lentibacillus kapialis]|uniref:DUF443 family protein n=1 Tax=Lentibacillus kapialis TaxID=340214 RepID=A0A917Q310_9BACI|nr:DUF443 family protein [Lentibacillus kapialis]GGK09157.1 hypothetical protein GCM10007063_34520 [Lentibacillus kapialis]
MNCKVQGVFKNLRYRILAIDGEVYILDMGCSFWKMIFPFFFWMSPNPVFRVEDPNIVEKLKSPERSQTKTGHSSILGAGIGVFITTLLKPLANYFALPDTPLINTMILVMVVIFAFVLFVSLYNMFKKKLHRIVNLEELVTDKLWIRANSIKHFFQFVIYYLFFLGLTLLFCYLSIVDPDVVTQIFTAGVLFFLLIISPGAVTMGTTTVKFKRGKKTAV